MKKKDKHNFDIVIKHPTNLETNPKYYGKPLKERLSGLWSYRIGNFRIIYEIQETTKIIFIITIGHRRNVYD